MARVSEVEAKDREILRLLAADEGVHWPDTPAIGPDGRLVFTASNLNRHFAGQVKPGEERYELWRVSRK